MMKRWKNIFFQHQSKGKQIICCPGAVIQWPAVIFGIANKNARHYQRHCARHYGQLHVGGFSVMCRERLPCLQPPHLVLFPCMTIHRVFYYKLERRKNEESEDCWPLLHSTGGAPCTERCESLQAPGDKMWTQGRSDRKGKRQERRKAVYNRQKQTKQEEGNEKK